MGLYGPTGKYGRALKATGRPRLRAFHVTLHAKMKDFHAFSVDDSAVRGKEAQRIICS